MTYEIIGTGSKGNAIVVNDYLLLDCGLSYKKIEKYLDKIKIIFISHKHSDHLNRATIRKISYEYPSIMFIVGNPLVAELMLCNVKSNRIITLPLEKWYDIGIFKVRLDYLIHDTPNDCIHIEFKDGTKLFYATDTTSLNHIEAKNYDIYFVEANYDTDEELEKRIKEAKEKGEFTYLERVKYTHLSALDALNWYDKNKGENSNVVFIHQHQKDKEKE